MPCFYRPIVRPTSVLYIFHVASCNYVLLDWERAMNAHGSITSRKTGCGLTVFLGTFRFAPTERY